MFVDIFALTCKDEGDLAETVIKFDAIVYKVQTLSDGGIRLTLDMSETSIPQMAMLAETKREGIPLEFTAKVQH